MYSPARTSPAPSTRERRRWSRSLWIEYVARSLGLAPGSMSSQICSKVSTTVSSSKQDSALWRARANRATRKQRSTVLRSRPMPSRCSEPISRAESITIRSNHFIGTCGGNYRIRHSCGHAKPQTGHWPNNALTGPGRRAITSNAPVPSHPAGFSPAPSSSVFKVAGWLWARRIAAALGTFHPSR